MFGQATQTGVMSLSTCSPAVKRTQLKYKQDITMIYKACSTMMRNNQKFIVYEYYGSRLDHVHQRTLLALVCEQFRVGLVLNVGN